MNLLSVGFECYNSSMKIAIGTLRTPKVEGIRSGVATCPYFAEVESGVEYITRNVSSGISHMPTTVSEVMEGAKNRADNLVKETIVADYYVGIEGGTSYIGESSYIFGCVYVRDSAGVGHFGFSPMIEVPSICERMIYEEGKELGPIMDELSGMLDMRSANGAMGAWSNNMFSRKDEFALAFKAAIAPFYNEYYRMK